MGKALYRVYRSKTLSELVGQEHITTTLQNTIKKGSVAHAYLFTGPRGVGKTSVARIFAHDVNKLPYDINEAHIDIIEIDAASNRRIDEIRDLRDKVHIAPVRAKYKVYIIDEVHMLTKEAFNALLKTLEEPPAHVIFILATTEFHKLPETIVSRCLHFTFRPITSDSVVGHLKEIAKKEGIKVDDEAIQLIAEHGKGSFRDSISLLDQIRNSENKITRNTVEKALGYIGGDSIDSLTSLMQEGDANESLQLLSSLYTLGATPETIASQLSSHLRQLLVAGQGTFDHDETFKLLRGLLRVPASREPKAELELLILEIVLAQNKTASVKQPSAPKRISEIKAPTEEVVIEEVIPQPTEEMSPESTDLWESTLEALKGKNRTLYGVARMAEVREDKDSLTLSFNFAFHARQMNENKPILSEIVMKTNPKIVQINISQNTVIPTKVETPVKKNETLNNITNIFGSSEVLES